MSHIEEGTTTITLKALVPLIRQGDPTALQHHPCMALLRQAVALVATAHHGRIVTTYFDYDYHPQPTNTHLALIVPGELPRGIGLIVDLDTGALLFRGDPWRHAAFFQQAQTQIVRTYTTLAYAAALRRMHAQVSTRMVDQQVVITGVFHDR